MKSADIAEHAPGATLERKDVVDGFHSFDITFHSFDITKITPIGGATKRYFDVTVAMIALILLAPVFIAVTCLLMFTAESLNVSSLRRCSRTVRRHSKNICSKTAKHARSGMKQES